MAAVGGNRVPKRRKSAALVPEARGMPNMGTSVQANLAVLQAKNVLGSPWKDLAEQVALPSSRYANLIAGMSTAGLLAQASAAQRMATANLAVQAVVRNPAWLEATRGLSSTLKIQHASAFSKMLGDVQASSVLTDAAKRWSALQGKLLADIARPGPGNDALLGKFAGLIKSMDASVANSLAIQNAAGIAARAVTLRLSEQLRLSGMTSSAWQKLFRLSRHGCG